MTIARTYKVRYLSGSYNADASSYGVRNYGSEQFTYGQEQQESVLSGIDYDLLPYPGGHPSTPEWVYRVGDETRFSVVIVDKGNPSSAIAVAPIVKAVVVLQKYTFKGEALRRVYELTTDPKNNLLYRDWLPSDLFEEGRYRVNVQILFGSGRQFTIEGTDSVELFINSSPTGIVPQ